MIIIFIFELLILAYLAADDVEQYRDKDRVRHGGGMWVAILLLLIGNAFWTYVMEIPIGRPSSQRYSFLRSGGCYTTCILISMPLDGKDGPLSEQPPL